MSCCRLPTHSCSRVLDTSAPTGASGLPSSSGSTQGSCSRNMRRSGVTGITSCSNLRLTNSPSDTH